MIDFVFPSNNEQGFIDNATLLGYSKICFVYDNPRLKSDVISELRKNTRIEIAVGGMQGKGFDYMLGDATKNARNLIESKKINLLFNTEKIKINQVLAELAFSNKVSIGFSFCSFLKNKKDHSLVRNFQLNYRLCRKYKANVVFGSFARSPNEMRSYYDMKSFFEVISR